MQDYQERKLQLKQQQYSSSEKNIPLAVHALILYLLFLSIDVVGRICLQAVYRIHIPTNQNLDNYQWFCFQIVAIIGLAQLPKIVNFVTFRIILLVGSLGPQIFLAPAYYAMQEDSVEWAIILIAIPSSIIAGILSVIFLFGMLYYLSNLSFGNEKILYYCSIYFIHSCQWIVGSFLGGIFNFEKLSLEQILFYVAILQMTISLLFLTIFEPQNPRIKSRRDQILTLLEFKNNKQKEQTRDIRALIIGNTQVEDSSKSISEEDVKKAIIANFTLQCFSIDQSSLTISIDNDQFAIENNNYYVNIYRTFQKLFSQGLGYIIPTIFTIACLQTFIYVELGNLANLMSYNKQDHVQVKENDLYVYVGLGSVLGCFAISLFGDYKDKMIWMVFQISILQFCFIFAWISIYYSNIFFFAQIFSAILGFCGSGLTSTIITFMSYEYSNQIYMIDIIFIIYTACFGASSLLFTVGTGTLDYQFEIEFILIQAFGIINYYSLYSYYKSRKNRVDTK